MQRAGVLNLAAEEPSGFLSVLGRRQRERPADIARLAELAGVAERLLAHHPLRIAALADQLQVEN